MSAPYLSLLLTAALSTALLSGCDGSSSEGSGDWRVNVERFRSQGDYKSAAIEVKNALKLTPGDPDLRLLLGQLQVSQQDFSGAEKELKRALSLGVSLEKVAPALATAYYQQQKWQELLDEVPADSVAEGSRAWIALQLQRAVAFARVGNVEGAKKTYDQVLVAEPGHASALLGLGTLALAKGDLEQADSLLDSAMKAAPADPAVWLQIGKLRYQQHRYDDAILSFKRALRSNQSPQEVHIGLAWVYFAKGRDDLVRKEAMAVRKLNAEHPVANYLLAALAFKNGDNEKAQDFLAFITTDSGADAKTVLLNAANNQALGNYAQAESMIRDFLKVEPGFLPAQTILAEVLQAQGRSRAAFEGLQGAARRSGKEGVVALDLAKLALQSNRPNEAKAYLNTAIAAGDTRPEVLAAKQKLDQGFVHRAIALLENMDEAATESTAAGEAAGEMVSDQQLIDGERLSSATKLLGQGNFAQAEELASALVTEFPQSPEALNLLGSAQAAQDRLDEARASFGRAAALQPNYPRANRNLFVLEIGLKNYAAARELVDRELEKFPLDSDLLASRARVAMLLGDQDDSIRWLSKVLEVNPADVSARINMTQLYLAQGDPQAAELVIDKAYRTNPSNPRVLELKGRVAEASKQRGKAIGFYQQLVDVAPKQATGYQRLASLLLAKGDVDAAIATLEDYLNNLPASVDGATALVRLYLRSGDTAEAMKTARALQQAMPKSINGYVLEADVKAASGDTREAEQLYSVAYDRQPSLAIARALYRMRVTAGDGDSAIEPLQQWVNQHSADVAARIALANARLRAGDASRASAELETVLKLDAENAVALNNLANIALQAGDGKRALAFAERGYRVSPDNPALADTWGWLLVNNNRADEALGPLTSAASQLPDSAEINYHLAAALVAVGRDEDALTHLQQALSGGADFVGRKDAEALKMKLGN